MWELAMYDDGRSSFPTRSLQPRAWTGDRVAEPLGDSLLIPSRALDMNASSTRGTHGGFDLGGGDTLLAPAQGEARAAAVDEVIAAVA
jgi:hypothetical protein